MPITSLTCRSLSNGQAGFYLSLRGLLVVLVLISQLSALNFSARATELTDLGEGLSYLRIHAIDDSAKGLTAAIRERDFVIVDLRHAAATAELTELLSAAFQARMVKWPVFILVGPATPTVIVDSFGSAPGKCITLGVKESFPVPRVVIDQPAETDRLAYEALESGQSLASLITGKISKERYDEAVLMKEFIDGGPSTAPASDSTAKPDSSEKISTTASKSVEPLTDRVLQRAVHLHRALLALKTRSR